MKKNYAIKADHLGVLAFVYVLVYALVNYNNDWMTNLLLVVGVIGLLVDGGLLVRHYM